MGTRWAGWVGARTAWRVTAGLGGLVRGGRLWGRPSVVFTPHVAARPPLPSPPQRCGRGHSVCHAAYTLAPRRAPPLAAQPSAMARALLLTLALATAAVAAAERELLCGAVLNGVGGALGSTLEKKTGVVKPVRAGWGTLGGGDGRTGVRGRRGGGRAPGPLQLRPRTLAARAAGGCSAAAAPPVRRHRPAASSGTSAMINAPSLRGRDAKGAGLASRAPQTRGERCVPGRGAHAPRAAHPDPQPPGYRTGVFFRPHGYRGAACGARIPANT